MSFFNNAMGLGLRAINRFAGSPLVDRLRLRKPAEKVLYHGSRAGFRAASAAARAFKATSTLGRPARLKTGEARGLFDLTPGDEQQMLREAAQNFAQEQLRTAAHAADAASQAPEALLAQAAELGFTQLGIPEELGGVGSERSTVANVLVAEALAQGDMGLAVACLAPSAVSTALVLWGDAQQQAQYLPAFVGDRPPVAALAIMEPRPLFDALSLQTTARRDGNDYVLDGVKALVPRAAQAELFIVAAQTEHGPALFVVESGDAALTIEADPGMGLRAAALGRLHLKNLRVPASALLAQGSAEVYAECLALSRLGWCALAVGTAQAALDYLIPYVNDRVAFGEPISHRQSVAFAVSNIAIELDGMRLTTWRAAARAEQGEDFVRETAIARRLCADKGVVIGADAVQLLGGHGFTTEYPVERWYRDLRAAGLMEGTVLV